MTVNPWINVGHILTTIGLAGGFLAYANSTENQTVINETKLESIQETQIKNEQKLEKIQDQQRQIRDLLIEIKTKVQ